MVDIEVAKASEAPEACEVLRRSIREACAADHRNDAGILSNWLRNKTPETIESWFRWPAHFPLVARRGVHVVGVAMLARRGKIVLLHVDPSSRLCGVGSSLLRSLEMKAKKAGVSVLRVTSPASARSFYERHGYAVTGTTNAVYGPALAMAKRLSIDVDANAHRYRSTIAEKSSSGDSLDRGEKFTKQDCS